MTQLVGKILKKSRKITEADLNAASELTILVLTFMFCIYAVSPIV
jgi:hypothetical protein